MSKKYFKTEANWNNEIKKFLTMAQMRETDAFQIIGRMVHSSITVGSPRTGAPGQPVDTTDLLVSYKKTTTKNNIIVASTLRYAPIYEYKLNGGRLKSKVGGFHSIMLTRLNFRHLVKGAVRIAVKNNPSS